MRRDRDNEKFLILIYEVKDTLPITASLNTIFYQGKVRTRHPTADFLMPLWKEPHTLCAPKVGSGKRRVSVSIWCESLNRILNPYVGVRETVGWYWYGNFLIHSERHDYALHLALRRISNLPLQRWTRRSWSVSRANFSRRDWLGYNSKIFTAYDQQQWSNKMLKSRHEYACSISAHSKRRGSWRETGDEVGCPQSG